MANSPRSQQASSLTGRVPFGQCFQTGSYRTLTIHRAIAWEKILVEHSLVTPAQIAEYEGINQHYLRALIRLTRLTPEIQDFLKNLTEPKELRIFNEKNIRSLIPLSKEKQYEQFQILQKQWRQKTLNPSL